MIGSQVQVKVLVKSSEVEAQSFGMDIGSLLRLPSVARVPANEAEGV